jgi:hypothetical protein
MDAPPAIGPGGRRGRNSFGDLAPSGAGGSGGGSSHKRGRGRKVSFKEAERQRLAAEAAEQAQAASAGSPLGGGDGPAGGMAAVPPQAFNYPDAQLPLASREESNLPLCGAVPAAADYAIPENSKVCAKPPSTKMQPQDWILGTVLKFAPASNKYIILDEDDSDADPWATESSQRQHTVSARMVIALPLTEPTLYTQYNEIGKGVWVLALYPDTTCFYKALVHTPPSRMGDHPPRDYLVEFEDEAEASGRGEAMRVPQRYVLRLPM